MPQVERGHVGEGGNAVITLSSPMVDRLDEGQLAGLVDTLVSLSRSGRTEGELADDLAEHLSGLGIEQPKVVVDRMVENLRNADDLAVVTDRGRVLHGNPSWTPAAHDPDVESTEDPQHPDRPLYS